MVTRETDIRRILLARMNPGEDLLLSLRNAVAQHGVRNGLVLSGIGSLSRYRVHVVKTTNMPPGDVFFDGEGPFDILAVTGAILDGRVHAHITVSDADKAIGGHLEEGCHVLTFCVVVVAETEGVEMGDWDHLGPL